MRLQLSLMAALATIAAGGPIAASPQAPSPPDSNPLCVFHGEGCYAPPAAWIWERLEPSAGGFSVELPCAPEQADRFGPVLAMTPGKFSPAATRACMKNTSAFMASMIGFAGDTLESGMQAEIDTMLDGASDLFTAFVRKTRGSSASETSYKGRRAVMNTIEKEHRRTRVMLVEVGPYGVIMLTVDINSDFPGTREEGDAAMERFISSLEIEA
jgi:hypothetical protein